MKRARRCIDRFAHPRDAIMHVPAASARRTLLFALLLAALAVPSVFVTPANAQATQNFPVIGTIHRLDPKLDELIPKDAKI
jgi:hypothetical protein